MGATSTKQQSFDAIDGVEDTNKNTELLLHKGEKKCNGIIEKKENINPEETDSDEEVEISELHDISEYCKPLLQYCFCGQTNMESDQTDIADCKEVLNLGLYLSLAEKILRSQQPKEFTAKEEEFKQLLRLIAVKRKKLDETSESCFKRLVKQSKRFERVYRERGVLSEECEHEKYWGTRQQLLAGKVIADWIDIEKGPLDPIFGVLMNPTAGRVGPGDTGWFHRLLYDETGYMAYHSAVHDGFGYLETFHKIGPGYDYLGAHWLSKTNSMAGQITGISFWKDIIEEVEKKNEVIRRLKI